MRDLETIELALTAAATGHLVFGTLHTPSAPKTIDRIIDVFPGEPAEPDSRLARGIAQRRGGAESFPPHRQARPLAALEVLVVDTPIANLIREGKTHQIPGMMQVGKKKGNQPLDDAIMEHLRAARISPEEAYEKAMDKKKFRVFLKNPPDDWED